MPPFLFEVEGKSVTGTRAGCEKIGHEDGKQQSIHDETGDGLSEEAAHSVFGRATESDDGEHHANAHQGGNDQFKD
jgi:hypothetical protein